MESATNISITKRNPQNSFVGRAKAVSSDVYNVSVPIDESYHIDRYDAKIIEFERKLSFMGMLHTQVMTGLITNNKVLAALSQVRT